MYEVEAMNRHGLLARTIGWIDVRHQSEQGDADMRIVGPGPALRTSPEAAWVGRVAFVTEAVAAA